MSDREEFEKWAVVETGYPFPLELARMPRGEYKYDDTRFAWLIWQAAYDGGLEAAAKIVDDCLCAEFGQGRDIVEAIRRLKREG